MMCRARRNEIYAKILTVGSGIYGARRMTGSMIDLRCRDDLWFFTIGNAIVAAKRDVKAIKVEGVLWESIFRRV